MGLFKLKTTNRETESLNAIDTWVVEWTRRWGKYSDETSQAFQAFVNEDDANKFAESLKQAFKLIGQTSGNYVSVSKQKNGL